MEEALNIIKLNGKYQKILIFVLISTSFLSSVISVSYSYLTKHPSYECSIKSSNSPFKECDYNNGEFCEYNSEYYFRKNYEKSLHNWSYSFDLYCQNEYYIPLIGSSFFFGGILGSIIVTPLPDKYGRKKIFNFLIFLSCIVHINLFLCFNPSFLVLLCFISGFCYSIYGMFGVIMSEYLPINEISMLMTYSNAIYPLAGVLLAFFFLYINNWRIFFGFTATLHIITTFLALYYFTESPKWLFSQAKFEECINVLNTISLYNNTNTQWKDYLLKNKGNIFNLKNTVNVLKKKMTTNVNHISIFKIITYPSQRNKILILILLWYGSSFCFYGIILNLNKLEGDFFLLSILAFLGEMISEVISGYLADFYGRVFVLKYGGFLGGIGFAIYKIVPEKLKAILIFFSMFGFAATFNVIYIYTPEIIPISIRGTMCEFLFLLSRFAPFCVPILTELIGHLIDVVFIVFGIFYGFSCFGLEETLGKDLNEEIPEISSFISKDDSNTESDGFSYFSLISGNDIIEMSFSYSRLK